MRNPSVPALQESAQRQIEDLVSALERSTKGLIAGDAEEMTNGSEQRARRILRRIKALSALASGGKSNPTVLNAPEEPAAPANRSAPNLRRRRSTELQSSAPAPSNNDSEVPRIRFRSAAESLREPPASPPVKSPDRSTETPRREADFDRIRAAFPNDDPIKDLEEIKSRVFGPG